MGKSIIERNGNKAVLTLKEDIIASAVNDLRTLIKDTITEGAKNLTIDMSGISGIDSMGIGLLISTQNSLSKIEGTLEIVNVSPDIMDLFQSMRLDQHFSLKGE